MSEATCHGQFRQHNPAVMGAVREAVEPEGSFSQEGQMGEPTKAHKRGQERKQVDAK